MRLKLDYQPRSGEVTLGNTPHEQRCVLGPAAPLENQDMEQTLLQHLQRWS